MSTLISSVSAAQEICSRVELVSPARYEDREIEVTYEAHDRLFVVPATYKTVEQDFVVTEAHCPGENMIAKSLTVVLEDPNPSIRIIPVKFKRIDGVNGTRVFSVEVPASMQYITIPLHPPQVKIRVRQEASEMHCTANELIPAETRTVQRRIVDKASYVRSELVPERTTTVVNRVLIEPARVSIQQESCDNE